MNELVRSFLALELPPAVKRRLEADRRLLERELPRARWVRPDGQHLTLKFLGDVPGVLLGTLAELLAPAVARMPRITVALAGAGFFPSPARPRVAWIGGRAEGVAGLVAVVEQVAERLGLPRERRAWSLHLTQARLDRPWPAPAVARFLEWGDRLQLEPFEAPEVVLFSSQLGPGGAVYTALQRMPLA